MKEPPTFGPNGAVLNSETMSNELRAQYETIETSTHTAGQLAQSISLTHIFLYGLFIPWMVLVLLAPQMIDTRTVGFERIWLATELIMLALAFIILTNWNRTSSRERLFLALAYIAIVINYFADPYPDKTALLTTVGLLTIAVIGAAFETARWIKLKIKP